MNQTLQTLIKVSQKKVEDKQKEIAKLLGVMAEMDAREATLKKKMVTESDFAANSSNTQLMQAAGGFCKGALQEMADIAEARIDAQKILEKKREDLRLLFLDQKQYEILNDRQAAERKRELQQKIQNELDDLAGGFRPESDF